MNDTWKDRWLAFDTEATGGSAMARLVSVATVLFIDGEPTETFLDHFNPGPIDWNRGEVKHAMRVNGLSRQFLEAQPSIDSRWPNILRSFSQASLWVAHNPTFDLRMLHNERAAWDAVTGQNSNHMVPRAAIVDTVRLDAFLCPNAQGRKLADVCDRWEVRLERAHEADADAAACGMVLAKMAPSLPDSRSELVRLGTKPRRQWRT